MFASFVFVCLQALLVGLCASEKLIIDTDAGADDVTAILLLLRAIAAKDPQVLPYEVIGITCSYGNTYEKNAEINILKALTIAQRTDIPVYAGSKRSLLENFKTDNYFGTDGLGDAEFEYPITVQVDQSKRAPEALIDLAKANAGNVTILALGPLTNLGLAIALDNDFTNYVNKFYVMGGSVKGVGNKSPNVEFNFAADPESDTIFFNAINQKSQIVLVPWETTADTPITKEWRKDILGTASSRYIQFLNQIEAISLSNEKKLWDCPDLMVTAVLLRPQIVNTAVDTNIQSVNDGKARGSILVDYYKLTGKLVNTHIIMSVDADSYKELLLRYLSCENTPCTHS